MPIGLVLRIPILRTFTRYNTHKLALSNRHFIANLTAFHFKGKAMFYTLAQAICSCVNANKKWRTEHVNRVLDELFKVPRPWRRDNVAGFLLFCSEKVCISPRTEPYAFTLTRQRRRNEIYAWDKSGYARTVRCCVGTRGEKLFKGLPTTVSA